MAATPAATPFEVGKAYFIRTVTYHLVGRVSDVGSRFITLQDAAWVADSGRFAQAIGSGILNEVEPVGVAFVAIEAITDAFPWVHSLPLKQK